jgi:purine-nucleoside phosphorylase
MKDCPLDRSVEGTLSEIAARGIGAPRALYLLGTGTGLLPQKLRHGGVLALRELKSVPRSWRELELFHGELAGAPVWILEDAPGPPELGNSLPADDPAWTAGWPCWLAASAGASLCVHTSAGPALPGAQPGGPEPGMIALVRDHINLSGRTPLVGLSESRLGPLFPDQSRLHHHELRKQALAAARKLGLACCEAVVACVAGPTLETPAERRFWAHAGAEVAVQELVNTLHACAHAGLSVLELVALTDRGEGIQDMAGLVANSLAIAPGLEDLLLEIAPAVARAAAELGVEEQA